MIGIISAMQEEVQALLHELKNITTTEKGKRTYYRGELFKKEVVIVFSRWGKVASAATTTQLINDFDLEEIIFTGDVLNTAARIQGICKIYDVDNLLSEDLLSILDESINVEIKEIGETELRGKEEKIKLYNEYYS